MKISIIGTGAIGGYYGMMLANAGHDVHFLLRSDYEYVKAHGLQLQSKMHDNIDLPKVNAYQKATDMPKSDIVLVALKTVQNKDVLPEILPHITDENSLVILIQNGLGMEEDLSAQFPVFANCGRCGAHCRSQNPKWRCHSSGLWQSQLRKLQLKRQHPIRYAGVTIYRGRCIVFASKS